MGHGSSRKPGQGILLRHVFFCLSTEETRPQIAVPSWGRDTAPTRKLKAEWLEGISETESSLRGWVEWDMVGCMDS